MFIPLEPRLFGGPPGGMNIHSASRRGVAESGRREGMQTIFITGATSGIGRCAALYLASRGHHVIASGRKADALAELAAEATARGNRLDVVRLDVTDRASIEAARAEAERLTEGRGVDALINNAGYVHAGPTAETTDEQIR